MKRLLPIILLIAGVYLLVGCIPIPATQQVMVNGKLKPSYSIGSGGKSLVRLNHTRIEDAMQSIDELVAGVQVGEGLFGMRGLPETAGQVHGRWVKLSDQQYVLAYNVRTATVIWPLCFTATTEWRPDFLILHVKDGIVTDFETTQHPEKAGVRDGRWAGYSYSDNPVPSTMPDIPPTRIQPTTRP